MSSAAVAIKSVKAAATAVSALISSQVRLKTPGPLQDNDLLY